MLQARLHSLSPSLLSLASRPIWTVAVGAAFILFSLFTYIHTSSYTPVPKTASRYTILPSGLLRDVQNQTLGFQKIFAINLPTRTDHRDSLALAAHFSNIQVDITDVVLDVAEKTLPPRPDGFQMPPANIGSWRAHLNAVRTIVEQKITSALIIEDDADWDIRIKAQLVGFARASRALVQPERTRNGRLIDPTNPRTSPLDEPPEFLLDVDALAEEPTTSPYGDTNRWDLLWLGHCGTRFPRAEETKIPLMRVFIENGETVPEPQHIAVEFGNRELYDKYEPHTRVVHRAAENVCTLAYALTLAGARRLLYELSINKLTAAYGLMLREMCEGNGRKMRTFFYLCSRSFFSIIGQRDRRRRLVRFRIMGMTRTQWHIR